MVWAQHRIDTSTQEGATQEGALYQNVRRQDRRTTQATTRPLPPQNQQARNLECSQGIGCRRQPQPTTTTRKTPPLCRPRQSRARLPYPQTSYTREQNIHGKPPQPASPPLFPAGTYLEVLASEQVEPALELHGIHALAHVGYVQRGLQKLARVAAVRGGEREGAGFT